MAATDTTHPIAPQTFDAEAKRRYAAGAVHAVLHQQAKGTAPMIHVELHQDQGEPTGDLLVRVYGLPGEWRLRLEAAPEVERF